MSYDAILQVSKAEETARDGLLTAQNKVRERIASAQSAAGETLLSTKKQLATESAEAVGLEREKNQNYAAEQLALSLAACEQLRGQALSHMNAAVVCVMERVMGEWH